MSPGAAARIAWIVSTVTRLPLISIPLFFAVGIAGANSAISGALWAALCLALTAGLSTLYLRYLRRNVRLGDPGRIEQGGGIRPLRVVAVQYLLAWAVVSALGVPFGLGSLVLLYALLVTLLATPAPEEEVSLHAAAVCGAAVALTHAFGPWGLLALILLPPVRRARLLLGRNTPWEITLGALAGAVGGAAVFLLT